MSGGAENPSSSEHVLVRIAAGTAGAAGPAFFQELVKQVALALGVRWSLMGEATPEGQIRTVAVWSGDAWADNLEYDPSTSPCGAVVQQGPRYVPHALRSHYPGATVARDLGADSYLGVPLVGSTGRALGLLAILHDAPTHFEEGIQRVLQVFAGRAATELERERAVRELADKERGQRTVLGQMPAMLWTADRDLRFTSAQGADALGSIVGMTIWEYFRDPAGTHPAIVAHLDALAGQSRNYEIEWLDRIWEVRVEPLRDPQEQTAGVVGVALDVTGRKRAEDALRQGRDELETRVQLRTAELQAANEKLRVSESRLAGILNAQSTLVARADLAYRTTYMNDAYARALDLKIGEPFTATIHPDDLLLTCDACHSLLQPPHACEIENRRLIHGQWRWIHWELSMVFDAEGRPAETQGVGFDIHDRKMVEEKLRRSELHFRDLAESNRRLLMELDHRVRNNVAGLLSLVSAMRITSQDVSSFADAIESRLGAMAHIHRLLADRGWQVVVLESLIRSLLDAMGSMACQPIPVEIAGPLVEIEAPKALPMAMLLLEWFTNSCKYGAHSSPEGRLEVSWTFDPSSRLVSLRWRELGGPPVKQMGAPSLGTELVRGFASRELAGRVELRFPESGADHLLEFPSA